VEEVARFARYTQSSTHRFLQRLYTPTELAYCFASQSHTAQRLAARFCAKEAIYKALSAFGESGISLQAIEVISQPRQAPGVKLHLPRLADTYRVRLSLSHTKTLAMAQVLVFRCVSPTINKLP
jgi:phosphopantetheine--protein transferase-like protein